MKLLMDNVEELFKALPQDHRVVYWDTISKTEYDHSVPITCYCIRVTGLIHLMPLEEWSLVEATIRCGSRTGGRYDDINQPSKEKVAQYNQQMQAAIEELSDCHCVQSRHGILTTDLTERLHDAVKEEKEIQHS